MMKRSILAAGVALGLLAGGPAMAEEKLNFGIISTESMSALKDSFQPFIDDFAAYMGVEVEAFFAPDYAGIIEGMRFDKVDVAWFGNKSAMEAVDRAGGEIFAQTIKDDGSEGYYSLLIAHKDSPVDSLEDVLACDGSLTFGNGDPNSTSGFLVPSYYVFALNGVDAKECFKEVVNANHETNALAVANQQVDIATNNTESIYARLAKTKPDAAAQIKEIWRSPLIPSDPMVWRKNLPDETKQKILSFFMTYGRFAEDEKELARQIEVLHGMSDGWGPFLMSSNLQLIPIRQLQLFRDKLNAEADEALSAEDKAAKVAEIEGKLADLERLSQIVAPVATN